jgi:hypothetical protein
VASLVADPAENSGRSMVDAAGAGDYDIAAVALDDEFDIRDRTIAIKIDVEGRELDVLAGAARLLGRNGGYVEIEGHGDERATKITALMRRYGWQFIDRYGLDLRFERARPVGAAVTPGDRWGARIFYAIITAPRWHGSVDRHGF